MITATNPLASMEDNLVDLRAIARLGLLAIENAETTELPSIRNELTTAFYLIVEKIDSAQKAVTLMTIQHGAMQ